MYEQRVVPPEDSFSTRPDAMWKPVALPLSPESTDSYVVVDERIYGRLTLAVAPWPRVDRAGRLLFERSAARGVREADLQTAVNDFRRRSDDEAADRPIRIGDVFLVRGLSGDDPSQWETIVDVSAQARQAAKIALHSAVAPVAPKDAELELEEEEEPPDLEEPPGPVARPSV